MDSEQQNYVFKNFQNENTDRPFSEQYFYICPSIESNNL